jgi:hypothetical protein
LAFDRAGVTFNLKCAKGAANKQYASQLDAKVRQHAISHTVSTDTASTRSSSTVQPFVTLGVCRTNGAGKNPIYIMLDTPIVRKLEKMMANAA